MPEFSFTLITVSALVSFILSSHTLLFPSFSVYYCHCTLFCPSALAEGIYLNDQGHLLMVVEVKNQKQQEHPSWKIYLGDSI